MCRYLTTYDLVYDEWNSLYNTVSRKKTMILELGESRPLYLLVINEPSLLDFVTWMIDWSYFLLSGIEATFFFFFFFFFLSNVFLLLCFKVNDQLVKNIFNFLPSDYSWKFFEMLLKLVTRFRVYWFIQYQTSRCKNTIMLPKTDVGDQWPSIAPWPFLDTPAIPPQKNL